jgi:hypothetical protein
VCGHALFETQMAPNMTLSKVRAHVEHVFGHQEGAMGGTIVGTIGIAQGDQRSG